MPAVLIGAWHSLEHVSLAALALAVALHVAKVIAEARSWHAIVSHAYARRDVRFRTTCAAFVSAIGANALLPARVGEALRVGIVRRGVPGSNVVTIAATIVLETGIEVVFGAAVIAAVVLGGVSFGSSGARALPLAGVGTYAMALAGLAIVVVSGLVLAVVFRDRARTLVARMEDGFAIVRSPRALVVGVICWKLVAWTLRLAAVYAFLLAFHAPAAPYDVIVVVAAQNLAGAVPLLPGNAGTQQAAIAVALAGSASAASLVGFGVGMQAATALSDVALATVALALVATRRDVRGALGTLLPRLREEPATRGA